jgi:hypothetical protein
VIGQAVVAFCLAGIIDKPFTPTCEFAWENVQEMLFPSSVAKKPSKPAKKPSKHAKKPSKHVKKKEAKRARAAAAAAAERYVFSCATDDLNQSSSVCSQANGAVFARPSPLPIAPVAHAVMQDPTLSAFNALAQPFGHDDAVSSTTQVNRLSEAICSVEFISVDRVGLA